MPPAGPPIVEESSRTLAVCSADGHVFAFGEAAIRSRVQDQPLAVQSAPPDLPAITAAVNLGRGRAAFWRRALTGCSSITRRRQGAGPMDQT